jgi:hypothetical protein
LSAKEPISFYIHLYNFWDDDVKCVQLENETNETLAIKVDDEDYYDVVISRYPIGTADEWIKEEMNQYSYYKWDNDYRNILIRKKNI